MTLPLGRYRHYKGNEYTVLGVARHSESLDEFVIYRPEYGDRKMWARPEPMFRESVVIDGVATPRFAFLGERNDLTEPCNLFENLPAETSREVFDTLLDSPGVRIERIVSNGQASPEGFWYDQDHSETVALLQGSARLRIGERTVELKPGDIVNIPAHTRHRVEETSTDGPTIWLAIHFA